MSTYRQFFYDVPSINSQSGSAYSASISDRDGIILMTSSLANQVHIASGGFNTSLYDFPIGSEFTVIQSGSGTTTITSGSRVVVRSNASDLSVNSQYTGVTCIKTGIDHWMVIGNIG